MWRFDGVSELTPARDLLTLGGLMQFVTGHITRAENQDQIAIASSFGQDL